MNPQLFALTALVIQDKGLVNVTLAAVAHLSHEELIVFVALDSNRVAFLVAESDLPNFWIDAHLLVKQLPRCFF